MKYLTVILCILLLVSFPASAQLSSTNEYDSRNSIVHKTASSEKYQTLLAVIKAVNLDQLLDESGPFTVFAPSDAAFENLSGTTVEYLLEPENRKELKNILTYHIVAGKLSASKILKAMCRGNGTATFTTIHGDNITATMHGIDIVLTDGFGNSATITVADSNQRNGIIHEIDSVILPGKVQS